MQLGGLMQTAGAFGQVQSAMSWFIGAYASLANWRAIVERLVTFHRAILEAQAAAQVGFVRDESPDGTVRLHDVTLALPNGTKLLENADLTFEPGHSVVVTGTSGAGKSTLFRAIGGIWPFGHGRIQVPANSFFLPQRPYIPLGSLRHVIAYPQPTDRFTRDDIAHALRDAGLPHLVDLIDRDENWPLRLSGGEQQRVALARALLAKPDWIFLDEATASLDPESEAHLYETLKERLPHATLVSIAHTPSVAAYHEQRLVLQRKQGAIGTLVPDAIVAAAGE
jgi:putative ATP-binding cassette transporter